MAVSRVASPIPSPRLSEPGAALVPQPGAAAPDRFFDDDHYRGYPAVLVRLQFEHRQALMQDARTRDEPAT